MMDAFAVLSRSAGSNVAARLIPEQQLAMLSTRFADLTEDAIEEREDDYVVEKARRDRELEKDQARRREQQLQRTMRSRGGAQEIYMDDLHEDAVDAGSRKYVVAT